MTRSRRLRPRSTAAMNSRRELWPELGELGLLGITVEEEYGGARARLSRACVAMEEVSRGSASVGLSYGAHSNLCVNQIRRNGQRRAEAAISAQADLGRACRRARHVGGGRRLRRRRDEAQGRPAAAIASSSTAPNSGSPTAPVADVLVVYAKTDPSGRRPRHHRLHHRERVRGLLHRPEARQARHARLRHRRARLRGLRGAAGERAGRAQSRRQGADVGPRLRAGGAGAGSARHHAGLRSTWSCPTSTSASSSASRSAASS